MVTGGAQYLLPDGVGAPAAGGAVGVPAAGGAVGSRLEAGGAVGVPAAGGAVGSRLEAERGRRPSRDRALYETLDGLLHAAGMVPAHERGGWRSWTASRTPSALPSISPLPPNACRRASCQPDGFITSCSQWSRSGP
jgi:hypothetical protein